MQRLVSATFWFVCVAATTFVAARVAAQPVTGGGTANKIPKFTGPTTLGDSVITERNGRIGIGTANPMALLDVFGGAFFRGSSAGTMFFANNGGTGDVVDFRSNNVTRFFITNAGNVGVGTSTPAATLDVNGTLAVGGREVIDASGRFVGSPGVALNPRQIALLRWYEANQTGISYPAGTETSGIAFDGENLWITNNNPSGQVYKLRASDGTNLGVFGVGAAPQGICFDGASVWIANRDSNNVTKLRARDGAPQGTFAVGGGPEGIAFDGTNVWVANRTSNTLSKLRARDGATVGTFATGPSPGSLAFDGANLWVVNTFGNSVTKTRTSDGTGLGTFPLGVSPTGIAFDGSSVWIANAFSNNVTKLRASDGHDLGSFPVGIRPLGVVFDGANIWVASVVDDTITKLRASDGSLVGTFVTDNVSNQMAFDGANVWVTSGSGVTKL